jgi:Kelch motif/Galactose oxidase, central domain
MSSSRKKNLSPSDSAPANGLASQSQASQPLQFPTGSHSQSHRQSPQQTQQSQPLYPWSAHTPPSGQLPSPFPRYLHALPTTVTAAGELFLFGGKSDGDNLNRKHNDLYVISTRDFSTTLLQTSGAVPNPRYGHRAVLTSTILLIWGGVTNFNDQVLRLQALDDSLYLLNLGTSDFWLLRPAPADQNFFHSSIARVDPHRVVNGSGPGGRHHHTMTLVGSKLFVFGGWSAKRRFNDIWALDLNCCAFGHCFPEQF